MAKFSIAILAALAASASAFVSHKVSSPKTTSLNAAEIWDPMGLLKLGEGESFDTFKGVFPNEQFLKAAEVKHGRQAMLAWTGVWATHEVRCVMLPLVYLYIVFYLLQIEHCTLYASLECSSDTFAVSLFPLSLTTTITITIGWIRSWLALPWLPQRA
jgi:hypothetical protein